MTAGPRGSTEGSTDARDPNDTSNDAAESDADPGTLCRADPGTFCRAGPGRAGVGQIAAGAAAMGTAGLSITVIPGVNDCTAAARLRAVWYAGSKHFRADV